MRCRQVIDKISEYIDGELDPELVRELERHLQHCEDCRRRSRYHAQNRRGFLPYGTRTSTQRRARTTEPNV
jgi:anti-sigma factor RsiW